jgi:peptidoglycan biosynthesis protein MviN/MurJ (putative lipid II flippase)
MLLLIPRLLFPHSILLGLNQQKTILMASVVEFTLNIVLSLTLLQFMGLQGIALGTVIAFVVNKTILLITLNKQGIPPSAYIPLKQLSTYSVILVIVFILFTYVV